MIRERVDDLLFCFNGALMIPSSFSFFLFLFFFFSWKGGVEILCYVMSGRSFCCNIYVGREAVF